MKIKYLSLGLILGLFFWGCSGETDSNGNVSGNSDSTSNTSSTGETAPPRALPFEDDANYLERMYVTSSGAHGFENLLDGDEGTWWEAMPGAGTDEGIMLYFEKPVFVQDVEVLTKDSGSKIKNIEVFGNGARVSKLDIPGRGEIAQELSSLFLRITKMEGEKEAYYYINEGSGTVAIMPEDALAAISEIRLFGKNGEQLKVRPLHLIPGSASSSSVLDPPEAYNADFLFDSRAEFGWAEGKEGTGAGESVSFKFDEPVRISKIKLWNGYQRSDKHFSSNERAKVISFGKKGSPVSGLQVKDEKGGQEIDLGQAIDGTEFELRVDEVYPGKSYEDLVLSELRFFDGQRWFAIHSPDVQKRKNALRDKIKGTSLEALVDRSIKDRWTHSPEDLAGSRTSSRNLILRSNGSFVLYMNDYDNDSQGRTEIRRVADGNWEIVEAGAQASKVKIFGKIHRLMDRQMYYKGKTKQNATRIFHEFLTVKPDLVSGEKLLDSIRPFLRENDLVDCDKYSGAKVNLVYASEDNFMKEYLYGECLPCMLQERTARALGEAKKALEEKAPGKYDFLIWDGYRPYSVQKQMWEKIKDPKYVADPYNGGSSHNKGAAIDLTLALKGEDKSIPMGTDFDHFGEEAHHSYKNLSEEELSNRKLLREVMEGAGFKALESEWWHYSLPGKFPIIDVYHSCDY